MIAQETEEERAAKRAAAKYVYFVAYNAGTFIGNIEMFLDVPIDTFAVVREVERAIAAVNGFSAPVLVTNWIPLKKPGPTNGADSADA